MRHRLGVLVAVGVLAACGGGDDDATPAESDTEQSAGSDEGTSGEDSSADEPPEDSGDDADTGVDDGNDSGLGDAGGDDSSGVDTGNDGDEGDDGNAISISNLDDIPQECRQVMGDFLREIEPVVSQIDWENATLEDLNELGTSLDAPTEDVGQAMAQAGCDDIDFAGGDESGFDLSIELARQEAPGVVGWLEFIRDASNSFDVGSDPDAADAPEDCDAAIQAVRDLMSETENITQLPVDQLLSASSTIQSVTSLCSIDEMTSLFDDPAFQDWTDG